MRFVCKGCGYTRDLPETPKVRCRCGTVYYAETQQYETDALAKPANPSRSDAPRSLAGKQVGTRLKNLIKWFPVPKKTNCGSCNRLERKMNAWGPEKCRVKMPYILAKLKIAAKRRGLPFSERLVRLVVERAIDG